MPGLTDWLSKLWTGRVVSGSLPAGLSMPATFTGAGDIVGGTAGQPGITGGSAFTMRLTDYNGQQATQQFTFTIDP